LLHGVSGNRLHADDLIIWLSVPVHLFCKTFDRPENMKDSDLQTAQVVAPDFLNQNQTLLFHQNIWKNVTHQVNLIVLSVSFLFLPD
jgi:hypothetical protein